MKTTLLAALTLATAAFSDDRPNVLVIAVDDLNDWIGCLGGHPQADTPNMDRLAARGVLFTNAHCAAPACNPSRAAVFSGLMPEKTGVWSNDSSSLDKLMPDAVQLPTALKKAGYATKGTGKMLHNSKKGPFEEYFAVEQRWSPITKKASDYTEADVVTKGTQNPRHIVTDSQGHEIVLPLNRMPSDRAPDSKSGESFDWGPWDVPDSDFGDTQITDWAIAQLKAGTDKPLFLGVGYYRPHIPLWAPARFFERFSNDPGRLPPTKEDDLDDLGKTGRQWAIEAVTAGRHDTTVKHGQWQAAVEAYLACISYVDHEIGRLLDALDHSTFGGNTAVILWSDHGWHLGEKQHWGKWTGWERSTRVPLIVAPPKSMADQFVKGGAQCDQPVGLIDLYPTVIELCGVKPTTTLDGQSLLPLLRDPSQVTGRRLLTRFDQGNTSLRTSQWRFIRYADGSEEFYDMKEDPNEWTNLIQASDYQTQIETLRESIVTPLGQN